RGHSVLVVDRNEAGYPLPRAVTHCSDFARILQSVGLSPDRIPEITQPYDDMYVWRNGAGQTLVEVDWSGLGESGWYNTYFFHQPALEDALDTLLAELPAVRVRRGW
ncbi:bifunctional 3-(3-hydroxy-phenyl)propionate/3-hydroxycinnamic acid hydroxylase, partial [Streptomyces sp. TRM76130]|nr:bifunctional 3-(3-hydroxy-phenyl)propionate/3-hydroxycinnamic acid hydroxylase [Streptomyces sp. TRM76130]